MYAYVQYVVICTIQARSRRSDHWEPERRNDVSCHPCYMKESQISTKYYSVAGALGRARGDVRLLPNVVVLVRDLGLVLGPALGLAAGIAKRRSPLLVL